MTATARGRDFWEQHIAALRSSGQTSAGYAREHGLSVHALGWWRRKLNRSQSTEPTRAVVAAKASKFVALKVAEPSGVRPLGMTMLLLGPTFRTSRRALNRNYRGVGGGFSGFSDTRRR